METEQRGATASQIRATFLSGSHAAEVGFLTEFLRAIAFVLPGVYSDVCVKGDVAITTKREICFLPSSHPFQLLMPLHP